MTDKKDSRQEEKAAQLGTLTDFQIKQECNNNRLITENYSEECVKQCCYELRASRTYYDLSTPEAHKETVGDGGYILIKPHQNIVIITEESLRLESNVLARVLSKGKLFSIGLLPVNTYADPGFDGRMGIVFYNSSENYIKIFPLHPIAKVEFCRLSAPVERPYHGQHGYGTNIWPIPRDMILGPKEIEDDARIKGRLAELERRCGPEFSGVLRRIEYVERRLVGASLIFFVLMLLLASGIFGIERFDALFAIAVGLISNVIFAVVFHVMSKYTP